MSRDGLKASNLALISVPCIIVYFFPYCKGLFCCIIADLLPIFKLPASILAMYYAWIILAEGYNLLDNPIISCAYN